MKTPRLGIAGGGQLGRMLIQAAHNLDIHVTVLDPTPGSPAIQIADEHIVGNFDDPESLHALAQVVDILTFEIESVHAKTLEDIAARKGDSVHPLPHTLSIISDKFRQKEFLREAGIPVAPFFLVDSKESIEKAAMKFGYPIVLKSRHGAYDGKGNATIRSEQDIEGAVRKLAGSTWYVEQYVPFEKELAVVAARTREGEIVTYPVVETVHANHICHIVMAPAPVSDEVRKKAEDLAAKVLSVFKGAGVFGIEMFLTKDGEVLVNEIAPRVHNSGHFTIEGCETSQFEQHVRAVTGLPLGSVAMRSPAVVMINILGDRAGSADPQGVEKAVALGNVAVHIYGKAETRPERKMGHITVWADTMEEALAKAKKAREYIRI